MHARASAAALLFLSLAVVACQDDVTAPGREDPGLTNGRGAAPDGPADPAPAGAGVTCPACTFEPRVFTRRTGTPVVEVVRFPGNPAGAYVITISDLGTQGANATVELNGQPLDARSGELRRDVALDWENTLRVRLTGKPGSQLDVRVFQEVAAVIVTPGSARLQIPATRQFRAVAEDRNGVLIPRQTFTWESRDLAVATVDAATGLARTTGPLHSTAAWNYKTIHTGEGVVAVVAHADGAPGRSGTTTLTVVSGFVYITWQAPMSKLSSRRSERPTRVPYWYDLARLRAMRATCADESHNLMWRDNPTWESQRLFMQCYPALELATPTRDWAAATIFTPAHYEPGPGQLNVGLYGRYCGAGHPDGNWYDLAGKPGYQPKDAVDAMCLEHDGSSDLHDLDPSDDAIEATCIVRYGVQEATLRYEGERVDPGTDRWNQFWAEWPEMERARDHWLTVTSVPCNALTYSRFLENRF